MRNLFFLKSFYRDNDYALFNSFSSTFYFFYKRLIFFFLKKNIFIEKISLKKVDSFYIFDIFFFKKKISEKKIEEPNYDINEEIHSAFVEAVERLTPERREELNLERFVTKKPEEENHEVAGLSQKGEYDILTQYIDKVDFLDKKEFLLTTNVFKKYKTCTSSFENIFFSFKRIKLKSFVKVLRLKSRLNYLFRSSKEEEIFFYPDFFQEKIRFKRNFIKRSLRIQSYSLSKLFRAFLPRESRRYVKRAKKRDTLIVLLKYFFLFFLFSPIKSYWFLWVFSKIFLDKTRKRSQRALFFSFKNLCQKLISSHSFGFSGIKFKIKGRINGRLRAKSLSFTLGHVPLQSHSKTIYKLRVDRSNLSYGSYSFHFLAFPNNNRVKKTKKNFYMENYEL